MMNEAFESTKSCVTISLIFRHDFGSVIINASTVLVLSTFWLGANETRNNAIHMHWLEYWRNFVESEVICKVSSGNGNNGFDLGPVLTYPNIFLIRNFFFPDSKIFPSMRSLCKSNSVACPHASDDIRIHSSTQSSSAIKCVQSMRLKARDSGEKFVAVVQPYRFIVRLETGHEFTTSSDSKISGFTLPHVTGFVKDLFFPFWRAGYVRIRYHSSHVPYIRTLF